MVLAQLAYQVIARGYNEQYEFEADEWAYRALRQIGGTHDESLAFHRRFQQHVRAKGLEATPGQPRNLVETAIHEVHNHFRTHPPVDERLRRLEALDERA